MTTLSPPPKTARVTRPRPARPVRTEARRGWWAALVTLVLLLGTLFEVLSPRDNLVFSWVWAHDALRTGGLLLGGPFAIAAGCWHGGRERRRGTGELFSSVSASPLRRTALAATPAVLWPVLGYLLTAAVCLAVTWLKWDPSYGHPFPTLIAADAVAMGSLGMLGFVAGRVFPWVFTGPVLAGSANVVMVGLTDGDIASPLVAGDELKWLSPLLEHWSPWDAPAWWFGPAAALWFGGLAVAALLLHTGVRRGAAASFAVALVSGSVLIGTGDGLWHADPGATALVCDGGKPQVCMVRVHQRYLPEISKMLKGVTGRLRHIPNAPERIVEVPPAEAGRPVGVDPRKHDSVLEELSINFRDLPEVIAGNQAFSAAEYGCRDEWKPDDTSPVPDKYRGAVAAWLAPSEWKPDRGPAHKVLERIKAMPERERTAWLGDYFAAVRDCRPDRIEAP